MKPLPWHSEQFQRFAAAGPALPHALLFSGPRGIGKLAFAHALAQRLLCESAAPASGACGACSACTWFAAASHPDYREIEPAQDEGSDGERKTAIGVDQIRALADFINMSSHRGGPKVIVLHPAEALNVNAANALLKNLEEPPARTFFMLVTHRSHLLLPTIRSRCQHVALRTPDAQEAAAWLAAEGVRDEALALAHMGNAPLLAREVQGTEYWGARAAFLRQLAARDIDVLAAAEAVRDYPILHVLAWLQKWSYDMVHYASVGAVRYNPDHAEAIARASAAAAPLSVLRVHREMVKLQRYAHHPLNARLFIEHVLIAYRELVQPEATPA